MVEKISAPKLYLTYEEDVKVPKKLPIFEKLAEFLGLPIAEIWSPEESDLKRDMHLHKLVSDDLRSTIRNYDEVSENVSLRQYL